MASKRAEAFAAGTAEPLQGFPSSPGAGLIKASAKPGKIPRVPGVSKRPKPFTVPKVPKPKIPKGA